MAKRKKQIRKSKKSTYFFRSLFILGIVFMLLGVVVKVNAQRIPSFDQVPVSYNLKTKANPERILVPSVGIDLNVHQTRIQDNIWEINEDGASHLNSSASPSENGNIIIYAHNTNDRFGNLHDLKSGEIIKIYTADQKIYTYQVKNILVVDPTRADLLLPTEKELLTIYTCTGFADLKRLVIQAEPKG